MSTAEHTLDTPKPPASTLVVLALSALFLTIIFWEEFNNMIYNWTMEDSYYSHGFLVPFISLFFAWRKREELIAAEVRPEPLGYVAVALGCLGIIASDFVGFGIFIQLMLVPVVAGVLLALYGWAYIRILWFPLAFLLFMIPIPASITQSMALHSKLLATDLAVALCRFFYLPMIRDGSFVHFTGDRLLVGEVCGGLRSLIALLAFGALMAYVSKTNVFGRAVILAVAAPVAIISNVLRIAFLCVIGFFYGSESVVGTVHDVSGYMIFVVAFILMFSVESVLRIIAPLREKPAANQAEEAGA